VAWRNIAKNDRSCSHNHVFANRDALFNGRLKADMAIASNGYISRQRRSWCNVYVVA
jgi:hypothetical protein